MRTYPALRTIASLIKILTILGVIVGLASIVGAIIGAASAGANTTVSGLAVFAQTVGLALGALLGWASAELLLVFANAGEDVASILARLAQTSASLTEAANVSRRSAAGVELPPARGFVAVPEAAARDPQQAAAERLYRQRVAEKKCVTCGVPLNFARASIEQKQKCPACEGASR